ncbi:TPR repeat-containing protein [Desulfovibrio sp. X2]|uniref:tetratricopeptide repeat protein n=1 Tax=Desulfovibrio sp. X2 TaxID=941449 RepID=UPI000358A81E|nr:tetratricopeptide repeat protein [Desulfovibrio sp. X2]EPR42804.1 TPR repeat-containing protein [Desulfovibrio sp. X2]
MAQGALRSPLSRGLVIVLAAALVGMFVSSILYRMENPSRQIVMRPAAQGPAGSQGMDMGGLRDLMKQLSEHPDDPAVQMDLARRFMTMGAWDRAALFAQNAVNLVPSSSEALTLYGLALFKLERYKEAAGIYSQLVQIDPKNIMAQYNLGVIYGHFLNDPAKAEEHFRAALALKPKDERLRTMIQSELDQNKGHGKQ